MKKLTELKTKNWINSKILTKKDFLGKIVLVHFWASSCVKCDRIMPYLREIQNSFIDKNLLIIGIHTPEFETEKSIESLRNVVINANLNWPVIIDNKYEFCKKFNNELWPSMYLFDKQKKLIYAHYGHIEYIKLKDIIKNLLKNKSVKPEIFENQSLEELCLINIPGTKTRWKKDESSRVILKN